MDEIKVNVTVPDVNFWKALEIYYVHPNSINKQVIFQENILCVNLKCNLSRTECQQLYEKLFTKLCKNSLNRDDVLNYGELKIAQSEFINDVFTKTGMYLIIRLLVPKMHKDDVKFYEFIFLDKAYTTAYIFTGSTSPDNKDEKQDPFVVLKFDFVQLTWDCDSVKISYNKALNEKGINWIKAIFVNKFTKLLLHENDNKKSKSCKLEFKNKVDVVEYYKLYEKLKQKYAKTLIENWAETTDPKKFVFEDIGIATYLILLWSGGKILDTKRQKFIDLGCGNGLLVHILNSEGHHGIGLDIRKRKIWDTYPSTTVLKEETIIPTTQTVYPEADWLIGNHSDELTAWLPIMARRSNRFCQYFVLPCCPYQLNGTKFQRKNSGFSAYQDFIHYVKDISELCHFETHVDKLRIPSTKRICLIGLNNSAISEEQYGVISKKIVDFVAQGCTNGKNTHFEYKLRESVEPVKNCTKVPYSVREEILKIVMKNLLKDNMMYNVVKNKGIHFWNRGGKMSIGHLAKSVDEELLKQLKSECKGLQTLLKNHHFLFEIDQGFVQFRAPENMIKICEKVRNDDSKWKRKNCWLFTNHPDGCPLSDDICSYTHV